VADVGCGLTWLLAYDGTVGVDESESVNYDLPFDGLDGVNDNSY
jgi:hypothetical protein